MRVGIKLIGLYKHHAGTDRLELELDDGTTVAEALRRLAKTISNEDFRRLLFGERGEDPRANSLILLRGKDVSVLGGLRTALRDGDELTLLPVVHGGVLVTLREMPSPHQLGIF